MTTGLTSDKFRRSLMRSLGWPAALLLLIPLILTALVLRLDAANRKVEHVHLTITVVGVLTILLALLVGNSVRRHLRFLSHSYDEALRKSDESQQLLERKVEERTRALKAANQELEAFSYSVSHDLRSPLRAMAGFSQALLEQGSGQMDPKCRDYLTRISAASQRMGSLIDDLLDLSRIGRNEIARLDVPLSEIAHDTFDQLQGSEPDRRVRVEIADGLRVKTDPALVRVILDNLINNAWKYTSKKSEAHITFGDKLEGERTIYFVRDDGCGFNMRYSDKLFGPFQRLHSAAEFPGNGIGLATVRRAVRRLGGEAWAESAPGQGSTFYFTLNENKGEPL